MEGSEAVDIFEASGVRLFVGVPDSLMKGFCTAVENHDGPSEHVLAANEGAAVAIATGHHLSTGRPAVVYMQNSGLGNAVNPLVSLASGQVYGVPMILMIGWRGEPGVPDEPQHRHQGSITTSQLDLLDIPFDIVGPEDDIASKLHSATAKATTAEGPVAILVRKGTFSSGSGLEGEAAFRRVDVIREAVEMLPKNTVFVATTGFTGRELALVREQRGDSWRSDFLMVGSMGHASALALGLALGAPDRIVCCLDGDGAIAMHMGSLASIGREAPGNLIHIVLNNGVHESVGGQTSVLAHVDLPAVASAAEYEYVVSVTTPEELAEALRKAILPKSGPVLIEAMIGPGTADGLPRPTEFERRARDLRNWLTRG